MCGTVSGAQKYVGSLITYSKAEAQQLDGDINILYIYFW